MFLNFTIFISIILYILHITNSYIYYSVNYISISYLGKVFYDTRTLHFIVRRLYLFRRPVAEFKFKLNLFRVIWRQKSSSIFQLEIGRTHVFLCVRRSFVFSLACIWLACRSLQLQFTVNRVLCR